MVGTVIGIVVGTVVGTVSTDVVVRSKVVVSKDVTVVLTNEGQPDDPGPVDEITHSKTTVMVELR